MRTIIVVIAALLLGQLVASGEPIERSQIRVKDGDTIIIGEGAAKHHRAQEYRLVGFDTPEISRARCPSEYERGVRAAARLIALLDSGPIDLTEVMCACRPGTHGTRACNYGRRCGRLTVAGRDVGGVLIAESLAAPYACAATRCPRPAGWCAR